jgi:arylamine N-acetyltransferase
VRGAELDASPDPVRVDALAEELRRLGPHVSPDEARQVAYRAVHYSEQLADWFGMIRPVEIHNVLVNLGLKRGGRCFEYAEFMLASLRELPLKTLELKRGIAWKDDTWNEHNCVVVTAVGQPFESGVVLDAWRNAGHLRFAPVSIDHYPWKLKPPPPKEMIVSSPRRSVREEEPARVSHAEDSTASREN